MQKTKNNKESLINAICLQIIPVSLVLLFTYTGTAKLIGHSLFLHQLAGISFLKNFTVLISYLIPVAEILVTFLLAFRTSGMLGLALSTLSMAFFTVYVAFILSGDHLPCNCGGLISQMSWTQHLYFNILFLIFSLTSLSCNKFLHVYKGVS